MATRTPKKGAPKRATPRTKLEPRDLLLAGVGAVSLGRKQAIRSIEGAGQTVAGLRKRFDATIKNAETQARKLRKQTEGDVARLKKQAQGKVAALRKQADGEVARLRKQAQTQVAQLRKQAGAQVDAVVVQVAARAERFAPVLAKLGLKPLARRPAKRTAARRPAKKVARKAA
jgi:vacuolar-type H+-ATPase subunit H